jgi:photosystem II stability/assembly factor-like uncharacterized protein
MAWTGLLVVLALASASCGGDDDDKKKKTVDGGGGTTGWNAAVGQDGTFVETFDDTNWQVRNVGPIDLHSVTCVGNTNGWAAGQDGWVAHTPDGGKTWQEQDSRTTKTLRSIHFAYQEAGSWEGTAPLIGIIAGDEGALATSTNGGKTWQPAGMPISVTLHSAVTVLSKKSFLAVGDAGTLVRSVDLGDSWVQSTIPDAGDLTGVSATQSGDVILVVDSNGTVWSSKDAGKTFASETDVDVKLNGVSIAENGSPALAVGEKGTLLERNSSGVWTPAVSGTTETLFAALVTHAGSKDYVSGEHGTLIGSEGKGWSVVAIPTQATLFAMENMDWN